MTTKHPRLNVTLDAPQMGLLATLAKRSGQSLSSTAQRLIVKALELEEDAWLSNVATVRDKKGAKWVSHKDAWK